MNINCRKNLKTSIIYTSFFFISIITAHARPITFKFEGVITSSDFDVSRTSDDIYGELEGNGNNVRTGFEPGDKFSGEYTFESEHPLGELDEASYWYHNVISNMSFVSGFNGAIGHDGIVRPNLRGRNTLKATNGTISLEDSTYDDGLYIADFNPVSAGQNEGTFYDPSIAPSSMGISWHSHGGNDHQKLLQGPPETPFFDTRVTEYTTASGGNFGPVYGNLFIYFDTNTRGPLVKGVIYSVTVSTSTKPNNDLIGHWPLNEGDGITAADSSGNGHTGILTNGPVWQNNSGNIDLLFDGKNDFVNLGTLEVPGNVMTVSAMVNPHALKNCNARDCRIISKATGTAEQDHYWMLSTIKVGNKTRLRFRLKTNGVTSTLIASSGDLVDNLPFHAAASYDGQTMRLFKDGKVVGTLAKSGKITNGNAVKVWIGGNPNVANSRPWKGVISDVKLYKKALTAKEIREMLE